MVRDDFPAGTTSEYQSVSPVVIVPTVMGDITAGRYRLPAGVTEYPGFLSTFNAETPDMSTRAQTRIAILVPVTFIVYRFCGFGIRHLKFLTQSSTRQESCRGVR